jgi:molecular chaperone GrpE
MNKEGEMNKLSPPVSDQPKQGEEGLLAELAETKDKLLRALAENENFRHRSERERRDAVRFAAAELVKDLLPAADSLSRALENAPPGDDASQNLLAGVAATERALQEAFTKHGIGKIEPALGEPFDPHRHQSLFQVEKSDYPAGTIAEVLQPGYVYHERLLRPALVGVAKGRSPRLRAGGNDRPLRRNQ